MKKFLALGFGILLIAAGVAYAQGVKHLPTFGSGAQITGIGYPCTTSCYVTASSGTFTANGSTAVTITDANITANSVVMFGLKTPNGTIAGQPYMSAVTAGTSFQVKAGASDTSAYNYVILN